MYGTISSLTRVIEQIPGRVVTVVGMYITVPSMKRVTVQVLDESLRWLGCIQTCHH